MTTERATDTRPSSTPVGRSLGLERGVVIVLGTLALAAGVLALVVGFGWLGNHRARRTVLDPLAVRWLRDFPRLAIACALVLGVVLVVLGLWWVTRILRPEPRPNVRLGGGSSEAVTITAAALSGAVRDDARSLSGVTRVRARMAGNPRHRHLRLVLSLQEGTDVRQVWDELDHKVLARARQALETEAVPTTIRFELDRAPRQRVR